VDRDKIHVMPNSPTVQSSHFEPEPSPMVIYYPAGQRILKKKGYEEYNYENYMKVFGDDIKKEDKKDIESSDKSTIRRNILKNVRKIELMGMLLYLVIFVLGVSLKNLYDTLSVNVIIENWNIVLNNQSDIIFALAFFFIMFIITWLVKSEVTTYKKTADWGILGFEK